MVMSWRFCQFSASLCFFWAWLISLGVQQARHWARKYRKNVLWPVSLKVKENACVPVALRGTWSLVLWLQLQAVLSPVARLSRLSTTPRWWNILPGVRGMGAGICCTETWPKIAADIRSVLWGNLFLWLGQVPKLVWHHLEWLTIWCGRWRESDRAEKYSSTGMVDMKASGSGPSNGST